MKTVNWRVWVLLCAMVNASWGVIAHGDGDVHSSRSAQDQKRDITSKPQAVLAFADIKPGMQVLDLFAGDGYYSQLLAQKVTAKGKVTMHNNQAYIPFVGDALTNRKASGGLDEVEQIVTEAEDLQLGKAKFDVVFMVLSFHDFWHKANGWDVEADDVMPQVMAALKPGGRVIIIDHMSATGRGNQDAQKLHRIDQAFVKQEMARRGFEFVAETDVLRNQGDQYELSAFAKEVRRKTDRFVHQYRKSEI